MTDWVESVSGPHGLQTAMALRLAINQAAQNLFHVTTIPKVQVAPRAISDPAVLQGRVSAADIYPNEQLAASNFTTPH